MGGIDTGGGDLEQTVWSFQIMGVELSGSAELGASAFVRLNFTRLYAILNGTFQKILQSFSQRQAAQLS